MIMYDKYSCSNRENLLLTIQIQLSGKLKSFFGNFIAFLQCTLKLEHFFQKNEPHSSSISEVIASERLAYLNA